MKGDAGSDCLSTLVVGIDGACRSILDSLFDDHALPALRGLFDSGTSGPLRSQIPPWTPSAWPSIYTGVNPGKHGVFDFVTFDGYDWRVVNATDVRARTLWEYFDAAGLSSVVVNVPVTYPVRPFDGALVPGYMAPEEPTCHPKGLLEELRNELDEYRVYATYAGDAVSRAEAVDEYRRLTRMRGEAFRYLVGRFRPDFGFVQFQQTDTVFHERPGDVRSVRAVYEAVDEQVDAILAAYDPDTVFVVSDHGIGRYGGYEFRVNEFLRREGYVETAVGGGGMPSWATVRETRLKEGETTMEPTRGGLERAMSLAATFGLTSHRIEAISSALGIDDLVLDLVPGSVVHAGTEHVDFARSRAYMRSRIELGVRVNLEGREPNGVVSRSQYESVREDLCSLLRAARTPDGDRVFETVARREEHFEGPATGRAVDIVTVPAAFDQFLSASLGGDVFDEPSEPWNHKRDGVIAAAGDAIEETGSCDGAHVFDVTPTVLAAMGLPVDRHMDGSVLPIVEQAGERQYPPFDPWRRVSTDASGVESRLADLGYLENPGTDREY